MQSQPTLYSTPQVHESQRNASAVYGAPPYQGPPYGPSVPVTPETSPWAQVKAHPSNPREQVIRGNSSARLREQAAVQSMAQAQAAAHPPAPTARASVPPSMAAPISMPVTVPAPAPALAVVPAVLPAAVPSPVATPVATSAAPNAAPFPATVPPMMSTAMPALPQTHVAASGMVNLPPHQSALPTRSANEPPPRPVRAGTVPLPRPDTPERDTHTDWMHEYRDDDSTGDRRSMSSVIDYLHHFDESHPMNEVPWDLRSGNTSVCDSPTMSPVAIPDEISATEDRNPIRKPSRTSLRNALSRVSSALTMTGSREQPSAPVPAQPPIQSTQATIPRTKSNREAFRDIPRIGYVYPAMLSQVAASFCEIIGTSERTKHGLSYPAAFDGREAVDLLSAIIRTHDRNLALLLGRALDAQKFFHDVTYDHRLRDTPNELYQFRDPRVIGAGLSPGVGIARGISDQSTACGQTHIDSLFSRRDADSSYATSIRDDTDEAAKGMEEVALSKDDGDFIDAETGMPVEGQLHNEHTQYPTGVFTLLTSCYSPTCARDRLCYSIACPRRLEQQARMNNMSRQDLAQSNNTEALGEVTEPGELWSESVPREVVESVSERERKRQEVIFEVVGTERQYVADLEYLRDYWIRPLSTQNLVPEARRAKFVQTVFCNVLDILAINQRLAEQLVRKQRVKPVVESIGDAFVEFLPLFEPYIQYGSNQLFGKAEFEHEKNINPFFARFVEDTERKAVSRKLELNGYLTKPTTRLARYPLLFGQVLKYTEESNPDSTILPQVVKQIQGLLSRVNDATGRSENRFQLGMLNQQLVFRPGEMVDLRLKEGNRELVFRGTLKKRGGAQSDSADIHVFLFDHALLLVKNKIIHKAEMHKVYRKPIPLEFLVVTIYEDVQSSRLSSRVRCISTRTTIGKRSNASVYGGAPPKQDAKTGFPITFAHLGKKGYYITLWAPTVASRSKWFEHVERRQEIQRSRSNIFDVIHLSEPLNETPINRITCAVPFDSGRRVVLGRDDGLYLADMHDRTKAPVMVLPLAGVTQVDLMEEHQILLVLADQSVHTFALDVLEPADPVSSLKRGRRVSSHTTFFKVGVCLGRTLVCIVKSGPLSSTIKTLEPIEQNIRSKKQPTFRKLLQGGQDMLRVFKEFYIPTESSSIHFLKSKLCIGCTKGFEVVDLETLDTQGLLDPADPSLEFVQRRQNLRPMAIYRIDGEFLLCYNEFAFYVNKNGWRTKGSWIVYWEGNPTAFAYHHPYVLAFESTFIEVRHVESGALHQVITGSNLRCLFADVPPVTMSQLSQQSARVQAQTAARTNSAMLARSRMPSQSSASGQSAVVSPVTMPVAQGPVAPIPVNPGSTQTVPFMPVSSPTTSTFGLPVQTSSPVPSVFGSPTIDSSIPALPGATPMGPYPIRVPQQVTINPVLESLAASRSQIIFLSDTSVYYVRLHYQAPPHV